MSYLFPYLFLFIQSVNVETSLEDSDSTGDSFFS